GTAKAQGAARRVLKNLTRIFDQDTAPPQRYTQLGIAAEKTHVFGHIKFDITAPERFIKQADQLKQEWQSGGRKIITLASTHAPEEKEILSALKAALEADPKLVCIVVPTHPERTD